MSGTLAIREAHLDDLEMIRNLAECTWRHSYPEIIGMDQVDYMLGWMYSADTIAKEITEREITYLLVAPVLPHQKESSPMGFAAFGSSDADPKNTAFLHKLYVHPDCQGQGMGSALISEIEDRVRKSQRTAIELRVNRENDNAIRAYESWGFFRHAEVCSDIGKGFVMDDYLMRKVLDRDREAS